MVLEACKTHEPTHGDLWTSIAKDPANARADTATKLKLCAEKIKADAEFQ